MIGSASGKLNGLFSFGKVSLEVIVEELASIVAIESKDREREGFFDVLDLFQDACFTFSPYGTLFGPTGGDIDEIDGVDIHTGRGIAAMRDSICFQKARARFIPLIGFDGYLFS
jgi:hypothetical protein